MLAILGVKMAMKAALRLANSQYVLPLLFSFLKNGQSQYKYLRGRFRYRCWSGTAPASAPGWRWFSELGGSQKLILPVASLTAFNVHRLQIKPRLISQYEASNL